MEFLSLAYVILFISIAVYTFNTDGKKQWATFKESGDWVSRTNILITTVLVALTVYMYPMVNGDEESFNLVMIGLGSLVSFYITMRLADA